ncbi:hypothetical protein BDY24DRAFT_379216 [Mrakia frigida]|uniref:uncharacterized protein n=1 Tax=Mrakia frigida TaxID=29902 RepID=UPI003FCBFBF7
MRFSFFVFSSLALVPSIFVLLFVCLPRSASCTSLVLFVSSSALSASSLSSIFDTRSRIFPLH